MFCLVHTQATFKIILNCYYYFALDYNYASQKKIQNKDIGNGPIFKIKIGLFED